VKDPCKTVVSGKNSLFYCNYGFIRMGRHGVSQDSRTGYYYQAEGEDTKIPLIRMKYLKNYFPKKSRADELLSQSITFETVESVSSYVFFGAIAYFGTTVALDAQADVTYRYKAHTTGILIGLSSLAAINLFSNIIAVSKLKGAVRAHNKASSKKTSFLQPLKPDYLTLGNAQGTVGVSIGWHLGR
jgi:hypothetical protein